MREHQDLQKGVVWMIYGGAAQSEAIKGELSPRLVSSNIKFGFKLILELLKKESGKNILISPSSVAAALAMTYNGAGGKTQQDMAATLELQGMSLEEVNHANAALKAALEEINSKVQLVLANSLWANKDIPFKLDFMQRNQEFYHADIANLDFSNPGAAQIINGWVSKKTGGKIKEIVEPPIDPLTILVLINAIYFKGKWSVPFEKANTKDGVFTLPGGKQKKVPMMSQSGDYLYFKGEDFQAVSLPYGDGRISMYIFLPDRNISLDEFQGKLSFDNWNDWMSQFHIMKGSIALPRFKIEYDAKLNDTLKTLGMAIAFDENRADFTGMCPFPPGIVYIGKVMHKTFMEVNEEGTEAAAATSVEMKALSISTSFTMIVDRPFFCAIRDNKTKSVLFMGSIVVPE